MKISEDLTTNSVRGLKILGRPVRQSHKAAVKFETFLFAPQLTGSNFVAFLPEHAGPGSHLAGSFLDPFPPLSASPLLGGVGRGRGGPAVDGCVCMVTQRMEVGVGW